MDAATLDLMKDSLTGMFVMLSSGMLCGVAVRLTR